jgi:hypothetical protein
MKRGELAWAAAFAAFGCAVAIAYACGGRSLPDLSGTDAGAIDAGQHDSATDGGGVPGCGFAGCPAHSECADMRTVRSYSDGLCVDGGCSYRITTYSCPSGTTCANGGCGGQPTAPPTTK